MAMRILAESRTDPDLNGPYGARDGRTTREASDDARARRLSARRAVLGRHRAARPGGRGRASTAACSAGSSRTGCRRTRPGATTWPSCGAGRRRRRVAAGGDAAGAGVEHLRLGRQRRRGRREGRRRPAARCSWSPSTSATPGRMARARRHRGRGVQRLAGRAQPGRPARQRARHVELQRAQHAATRRRARRSTAPCSAGRRDDARRWASITMWRRPGYGDFLERVDPGTRERMAGVGRARGLRGRRRLALMHDPGRPADEAAALEHHVRGRRRRRGRGAGRPSSAARWSVPPFDAPWVRMTVLRDPQGAVFTASKFVPPETG